ncbi:globin domain-containing protein [Streptacidiphilus neutrinimicus]|uniref:globin domain-containing protein n=1 Tax=Streptacidiphilus neutrinimicus TaxID=105420 RepID=UPI000A052046|nr:globin domain-containing protein [Streptacidiphilus neutrinimicus]
MSLLRKIGQLVNDAQPDSGRPLRPNEIALLRASRELLNPLADEMAVYFYAILFQRHPEVRLLFPANLDVQRSRLLQGVLRMIDLADDPANLAPFCRRLGRDHRKFEVLAHHYPAVGAALLDTLARFADGAWTPHLADIWSRAYQLVAQMMIAAAEDDAAVNPAVWHAQIVGHRLRGPNIAEVTVLPEAPYPFVAGQYASVETPWEPRMWRHYSPANAPREDGTLTFHVKAVPDGRVSRPLVNRARVGDLLRLGAAQGEMILDPRMERDLVCVAGGTGLAPIQALVDQAIRDGSGRYMDVFVGARTADELYGFEDLLRLAQRNHWLSVRAAVSHEEIPGLTGTLPEVLRKFGPYYRHDAYVSGPPGMVTSVTQVLLDLGVPRGRLRRDPFDAPALEAAGAAGGTASPRRLDRIPHQQLRT